MMTEPGLVQDFKRSIEAFAQDRLAPGARARAHSPDYPRETARLLAAQGLLGLSIPEQLGGQGAGLLAAVAAIQAVATGCPRSADIVQAGNFGPIRTFAEYATDGQRQRYLPGLLAGEQIIALGMTEPEAGSAVTELTTTATRHGGGYLVNGTKVFSTHSADADVFLVYLRYEPGLDGIGSVLIDRGGPGLTVGPPSRFMNGEQWCPLYFGPAPRGGIQETDQRLQHRTAGQRVAVHRSRPVRLRRGDGVPEVAPAVRPPAGRVSGAAVDVRRGRGQA
jgi:alkylation response protein AidB-like acyl-CoA dehydrogenase